MATTITSTATATTFVPDMVVGYSASRPTKNFIHDVIGRAAPDATANGAGLRSGNITLLFGTEAAKTAAVQSLITASTFQLASTDLASIDMFFIVAGDIVELLDPDTQRVWTVAFDWRETTS